MDMENAILSKQHIDFVSITCNKLDIICYDKMKLSSQSVNVIILKPLIPSYNYILYFSHFLTRYQLYINYIQFTFITS